LSNGANVNATNTNNRCTALHFASQNGNLEVAHLLCEKGANVNAALSSDGFTPLMMASFGGYLPLVRLLLEKGANKFATTPEGYLAFHLANSPTPAARYMIRKLLDPWTF